MAPQKVKRKLTAILSTDVKGSSEFMAKDEAGTTQTLTVYLDVDSRTMTASGDPKKRLAESTDPKVRKFLTPGEEGARVEAR